MKKTISLLLAAILLVSVTGVALADLFANVDTTDTAFIVEVGDGYYEIYVDQVYHSAIVQGPGTKTIKMSAGTHRLDVYAEGRFLTGGGVTGTFIEPTAEPTAEPTVKPNPPSPPSPPSPPKTEDKTKNAYGSIVKDANRIDVDYNAYPNKMDKKILVVVVDLEYKDPQKRELTIEKGLYLSEELIEQFKKEGKVNAFVNFAALESYYDFGGVRIEDDVLVTPDGARLLGKRRLPASPDEVEEAMRK